MTELDELIDKLTTVQGMVENTRGMILFPDVTWEMITKPVQDALSSVADIEKLILGIQEFNSGIMIYWSPRNGS